MKTAHVVICDVDNDGRPDIFLTVMVIGQQGQAQPLVLRNLGGEGFPKFSSLHTDKTLGYTATGPVGDYDGDGLLDVFLASWYPSSILYRNITKGGHWIKIRVQGNGKGFNRSGIGATVRLYKSGQGGKKEAYLGRRDISIGNGYSSGEEAEAHFGLGTLTKCDVEVTWQGVTHTRESTESNQTVTIEYP